MAFISAPEISSGLRERKLEPSAYFIKYNFKLVFKNSTI
jgi:hypothetical protein